MSKVKKLLAMLMAVVMTLGMSVTAFAAITGASIVVNGLSTANTQNVSIYEIYRLDANDNNWEKASWVPESVTPENLNDETIIEAMVEASSNATSEQTKTSSSLTGTVTFTDLQAGAYLVIATDTANKVVYNPMVAVTYKYGESNLIEATTATVVAKAESYTTEKKQNDSDAVVEVGDLVEYTITTTVPYNNGEVKSFTVTDTLTGATYYLTGPDVKGVEAVSEVTVGGSTVSGIEIPTSANEQSTFTIDMTSLLANNDYAGKEVIIRYTAKVLAVDTVTNTAESTNDPTSKTTTAYTGQMTITKYGEEDENHVRPVLPGAEFAVYRINNGTKEYAGIDTNGYITGVWYPEVEEGKVPEGAGKVITNAEGIAVVKGVNIGEYYFKETVAPDGYSINATDAKCVVTKNDTEGSISVTGSTSMDDTKMAELPSTGGIGTTIFTIGGCLIMIVAAGLFFATRRKAEK